MRHAFIYHGALERNHSKLVPGATSFEGTDGTVAEIAPWPESAFLRFGYMEKSGKKFCVVRAADSEADVILTNELVLEPGRHMGFGVRLGPEPTLIEDDTVVLTLLEDLIKKNADTAPALLKMRDRLKRAVNR